MSVRKVPEIIAEALAEWSPQRELVRAKAVSQAHALVESMLGKLEREDFERLFRLFRTDAPKGTSIEYTRVGAAFTGDSADLMLKNLPALNRWTERLWRVSDAKVANTLDEFYYPGGVPGAGQSYPTMLLHVRAPEHYWVYTEDGTGAGYRRLTGKGKSRDGAAYLEYTTWIRRTLRESFSVSTHAVDLVLRHAARRRTIGTVSPNAASPLSTGYDIDAAFAALTNDDDEGLDEFGDESVEDGTSETTGLETTGLETSADTSSFASSTTDDETDDTSGSTTDEGESALSTADVSSPDEDFDFTNFGDTWSLTIGLRLAAGRICQVRAPITHQWSEHGDLLPSLSAIEGIIASAGPNELDALGRQLFDALFAGPRLDDYRRARALAEQAGTPLHIVLKFYADAGDDLERYSIAEHLWETLIDPEHGPMAIDSRLRLIRKCWKHSPLPAPAPTPRVHMVIGLAAPLDQDHLDLIHEFAGFHALQQTSAVSTIEFRPSFGLASMGACIHATDVFHFAGHGEAGSLLLEGPDRMTQPLGSDALRALLDAPVPRVVVLNACQGSVAEGTAISMAEAFLARGVHAVVAMNGNFADGTALVFAEELHRRLAAGEDVAQAVTRARWRVFAEQRKTWFVPVLWLRGESFCLVDGDLAAADPVVTERVAELDAKAEALRPRATILLRLAGRPLPAAVRSELADTLLEQVREAPEPLAMLEWVLASEPELERQIARIEAHSCDPLDELREVASLLRRELVPSLGATASTLPDLIAALRSALAQLAPAAASAPEPRSEPEPEPDVCTLPFAASEPLASPATLDELVAEVKRSLVLDDALVRRCVIHLLAGRHLVLAGPPGTGKSTLARCLAAAFGYGVQMATANPEWTTFDTIGGLAPTSVRDRQGRMHVSFPFAPGCVLRAVEANWHALDGRMQRRASGTWLIIDEMNRAPLDQAFGDLFTALIEWEIRDPRRRAPLPIPRDFRLICTANTSDRRLLFEFSEALKRRFAYVEVPAFVGSERGLGSRERLLAGLRGRDGVGEVGDDAFAGIIDTLEQIVDRIRIVHPLGLAQVLDILTFVAVGRRHEGEAAKLLEVALVDNLVSALETLPGPALEALAGLLDGTIAAWCGRVRASAQAGYERDIAAKHTALALLAALGHASETAEIDPEAWPGLLEQHERELSRMQALPRAAALAKALRRIAVERHG